MLKKEFLKKSKLYLILDTQIADYQALLEIALVAVSCGVDIVQLRDKDGTSEDIISFTRRIRMFLPKNVLFIINDQVDAAFEAGADGVHIGQDDFPLNEARRLLGQSAVIGVSCQTFEQALIAESEGADYIGFGSVYKTLTKPTREPMDLKLLEKVVSRIRIPVFAIGGINQDNIFPLIDLGVKRVAVTRAILTATDVKEATKQLKEAISQAGVVQW